MISIKDSIARTTAAHRQFQAEIQKYLSTMPAYAPCQHHPGFHCQRDDKSSWSQKRPVYLPCELCQAALRDQQEIERLRRMGVPLILCGATFENWIPADEQAEAILTDVREFARLRRGFLPLLGELGTGKTHLAVAVLRTFKTGWLVKQSELLRCLRDTYRDKAAVDPVAKAKDVGCLVLDEMGLSAGGRDELPLLHDILDHRHGNRLPTVLTGNLSYDELCAAVGDRMTDRFRESTFAVLTFGGDSRRREARATYFEQI